MGVELTVNMYKNENIDEILSIVAQNENIRELTLIN